MSKLTFSIAKSKTKFLLLSPALEIVVLSYISPYLFSLGNLLQITQFGADLTLLSLGETLAMVGGKNGIDISIGSTMSPSGVILGLTVMGGASIPVAIVISSAAGTALGAVNDVLIAMAGVSVLTATLDTRHVYSLLVLYLTGGIPISEFPESFEWLSLKNTFGILNQILLVVTPVTILVFILIYKVKFGWCAYLMGTNPEAAKFTGICETKIRMGIYILAGVLVAISATVNSSQLITARADAGTGMEMQAITVAVLGGTSVAGSSRHLGGVLIGIIIVTVMNPGLQIANINPIWQLVVLGFILILIIIPNYMMNKFVARIEKDRE